ncbi:hypothetical protein Y032_0280g1216 [Ancylostoma ceylanicum]|uniref:Uncharacterized protein n=1 Tax=Ancylostoma ceylanicum TaxID=53326 RepID=A0A016S6T7_9BILA|nr:hypothetical protein Y032_0280g1216 [Ancylostoma ceylanicum]
MGGITPFSRSQYETIARSSIDEYWKMGSSRQRRTTSEQQHGVVVGSPELSYDKCWRNTNTALKIVPKDDASLARRCSASEVPSSADNKQNRRFVSNKVLLELRSNFKSGNRSASTSVGCGDVVNASAMSKLSNKSSSTLCRAFSVRAENAIQPSGLPSGHKSLEVDKEQSETQLEMSPCSPTVDSVLHNFGKLCPVDLTKSPLLTSSSIQVTWNAVIY